MRGGIKMTDTGRIISVSAKIFCPGVRYGIMEYESSQKRNKSSKN